LEEKFSVLDGSAPDDDNGGQRQQQSEGDFEMNAIEIHDHARKLYDSQGAKALAEAAQMARRYDETGDKRAGEDWRRIELALRQIHGAHVS
jgi:hypothetical protein